MSGSRKGWDSPSQGKELVAYDDPTPRATSPDSITSYTVDWELAKPQVTNSRTQAPRSAPPQPQAARPNRSSYGSVHYGTFANDPPIASGCPPWTGAMPPYGWSPGHPVPPGPPYEYSPQSGYPPPSTPHGNYSQGYGYPAAPGTPPPPLPTYSKYPQNPLCAAPTINPGKQKLRKEKGDKEIEEMRRELEQLKVEAKKREDEKYVKDAMGRILERQREIDDLIDRETKRKEKEQESLKFFAENPELWDKFKKKYDVPDT